jgi:spermidine/putrescine transport system permease protein
VGEAPLEAGSMRRPPHIRGAGRLANVALGTTLVLLYAPLGYLVMSSVNANPLSGAWQGVTGRWYRALAGDAAVRDAASTSVRLALLAALGSTVLGSLAAVAVRRRRLLGVVTNGLAGLRVAAPEVIMATGLAVLLPEVGLRFGFRAMAAAHIGYLSAFVALIVGARAAGADPTLEDAARDLGAGPWRVLRRVVLPDLRPAIVSSALLVTAFSFDDVALSLALRGPNDTTLPVYVLSATQRRVTPSIAALGVVVMVFGFSAFAVANVTNRSLLRRG